MPGMDLPGPNLLEVELGKVVDRVLELLRPTRTVRVHRWHAIECGGPDGALSLRKTEVEWHLAWYVHVDIRHRRQPVAILRLAVRPQAVVAQTGGERGFVRICHEQHAAL